MAQRRIDFDHKTFSDSLGRNRYVGTHGTLLTLMRNAYGAGSGEVWIEPITSRGSTRACRVVVASSAIDDLIIALIGLKEEDLKCHV
jgi:hypothetical protein